MKQTFLCAAVLAVLAGAAPFLCLAFPSPSRAVTAAAPASPETAAAPAAATADPGPTATQTPDPALTDARLDLLLYDEAAGVVVTVSPVEYMVGAAASEMPLTWPDDALISQMVASHTYALYSRDHGGSDADGWLQVNSALASGWTDEAALRARWGEDYEENHARLTALAEKAADSLVLYEGGPRPHRLSCHQQRLYRSQPAGLGGRPALSVRGGFRLGQVQRGVRGHHPVQRHPVCRRPHRPWA